MKLTLVHRLCDARAALSGRAAIGYVESVRSRHGGIRLSLAAEDINIGALVRQTEDGLDLVDCGRCVVVPACWPRIPLRPDH